jgi:hypothetical protein
MVAIRLSADTCRPCPQQPRNPEKSACWAQEKDGATRAHQPPVRKVCEKKKEKAKGK